MNYQRIYDEIIDNARDRNLDGYVEVHHILPRCMGGDDSSDNLVRLTAREHFLAHWLLVKINPEDKSLTYAWNMMCVGRITSSHLYKYAREKVSKVKTGVSWGNHSEETKRRMSKTRKGKKFGPRTEEAKHKMRLAKLGSKQSQETIDKRVRKVVKPVIATHIVTGEVLEFESIVSARSHPDNFDTNLISKCCKGKTRHHKNYVWRYADKS